MIQPHRKNLGFTIIEVSVIIAVIAVLATLAIVGYGTWRQQVVTATVQSDINGIAAAMESARNFDGSYPTTLPDNYTASNGVTLTLASSDGENYCIDAQSTEYADIRYYVSTEEDGEIKRGTCAGGEEFDGDYTAFVFDTRLPGCNGTTVQIPITSPSGSAGAEIIWGDDTTTGFTTASQAHTYPAEGVYTVLYDGPITTISTSGVNTDYRPCLVKIAQWGNSVTPTTLTLAGSTNLEYVATPPSTLTSLRDAFSGCTSFNQPIGDWDVSNVTTLQGAFFNADSFNQPIDSWNTANVTSLQSTFQANDAFNQPLNSWNTSKVTVMWTTFGGARAFNQPLDNWDTSKVTTMGVMFNEADSFNGDISTWDTSLVSDMSNMFSGADVFNQPIGGWNTGNVNRMDNMFTNARDFNQPIGSWDVADVTNFSGMFDQAYDFNQPLNNWNTGSATSMSGMFNTATSFNQPLSNWDVADVTTMWRMFRATPFNQNISTWNTGNVTTMYQMFHMNGVMNQNLSGWNVANVTNYDGFSEAAWTLPKPNFI